MNLAQTGFYVQHFLLAVILTGEEVLASLLKLMVVIFNVFNVDWAY